MQFNNCFFQYINLRGADLTTTCFDESKFFSVNLHGAILCEGFKFDGQLDNLELVRLYSTLMNEGKEKEAQSLNKILGPIYFDLYGGNLSGLNLSNAKLLNSNLINTNLTKANITNTLLF